MRLCHRLLASGVPALVLALTAISPAGAQGVIDMGGMSDEQAKAHFKVGKSLYESGRFTEAAVEWEQAYSLSQKEEILYNLYVAYRDASNLPKAIDALHRYLDTGKVEGPVRVNLEARLHAMEDANGRASVQQPEAAPVATPTATEPAPTATTVPSPATTPPPPQAEAGGSVLPYVLLGAGGALIVGSVVTGIVTSNKIVDIKDKCPDGACPADYDLDGNRHDARVWRTTTVVLAGAGVVTAGVGAVLLLVGQGGAQERATAAPVPAFACAPSACFGSVRGRF